jgi:hypothetical protein
MYSILLSLASANPNKYKNVPSIPLNLRIEKLSNEVAMNYNTKVIYVLPGGGSGVSSSTNLTSNSGFENFYLLWTKQRVEAAFKHFTSYGSKESIFLALSAGSLNAPNAQSLETGNIVFECQHIMQYLRDLGVNDGLIYGHNVMGHCWQWLDLTRLY